MGRRRRAGRLRGVRRSRRAQRLGHLRRTTRSSATPPCTSCWSTASGRRHGLAGSSPSLPETLRGYFASGYPLGAHAALGAVRPLAGIDVAWVFQPFLAFIAAVLALTLVGLLAGSSPRWRSAAIAALAAQPALVYAFALQGSVKELVTLWLVPLLVALVPLLADASERRARVRRRARIRAARPRAAGRGVRRVAGGIGVAVLPWLGPVLLVAPVARGAPPPRRPPDSRSSPWRSPAPGCSSRCRPFWTSATIWG